MKILYKFFLICFALLMISCSPTKNFVRVNPDFENIHSNMDTITVFSDALVAIDDNQDYYSAKSSRILDSLILFGTKHTLSKKGYQVKTVKPFLMGSFMDNVLSVPIKPLNAMKIDTMVLPYIFPNQFSEELVAAVSNISRKLYASVAFSGKIIQKALPATSDITSDLKTISKFTKSKYALFIFHQAALVNPEKMAAIAFAQLAITSAISGGSSMTAVTKANYFHTYVVLVELSFGKIIWSNYQRYNAVPVYANGNPLFELAQDSSSDIFRFVELASLSNHLINKWSSFNFYRFPKRTSSEFFKGYSEIREYPSQNLFYNLPHIANYKLDREKRIKIDSLVNKLSISDEIPIWNDQNTDPSSATNFVKLKELDSDIDSLNKYFQYAYYDRLKYKPALFGKTKLTFTALPGGENRNIKVVESTLNDPIMEYSITYILKMIKLPGANFRSKPVNVVHEISFGKTKK